MEVKKKYGGKITSPHTMQMLAIHNMVRFRYDAPLYAFWRNVYRCSARAIESQEGRHVAGMA